MICPFLCPMLISLFVIELLAVTLTGTDSSLEHSHVSLTIFMSVRRGWRQCC